uniref:Strictosidine synthase conserved region domain-containing protein n=1 Tax=Kalanchoe fedtschenkoi TaxID=63787 RepID=A0A7N0UG57_KALFE
MGSPPPSSQRTRTAPSWRRPMLLILSVILLPISTAILLYHLNASHPMPDITVRPNPSKHSFWLVHMEVIGLMELLGPEDLVHDPKNNVIYTGCSTGEIKQFTLSRVASETVVTSVAYTGGRPLGLALGEQGNLIVADADKGLLDVSLKGAIKVLATGAGGKQFKIPDGVDIAKDGMVYFTDASHKYSLDEYLLDILEGMPYGRLMSYNPKTKVTKVLLQDLYFANGVTIMPDQKALVFCETSMARCRKYYIKGEKRGKIEKFVENLPGLPDNIHYDKDEGVYWIALSMDIMNFKNASLECATVEKNSDTMDSCPGKLIQTANRYGGVLVVDSRGDTKTFYYDLDLSLISSVIRLKNFVYVGSFTYPYLLRLDLARYNTTN